MASKRKTQTQTTKTEGETQKVVKTEQQGGGNVINISVERTITSEHN